MVFRRPRADHQALRDLGVREPCAEERENLGFAFRQLPASRRRTPGGPEVAEELRGRVGIGPGAETSKIRNAARACSTASAGRPACKI